MKRKCTFPTSWGSVSFYHEGDTMKKMTLDKMQIEEKEFIGKAITNRFPEPKKNLSGYESMQVELIYKPNYNDFINAAYLTGLCTWDQERSNVISPKEKFKTKEKIVRCLLKKRAISAIIEMPMFAFRMTGIPRAITHQLVRHRNMSFSQQSFRVSSCYPDSVRVPNDMDAAQYEEYNKIVWRSRLLFKKMVKSGIPMEQARCIMPMGTTTKIVMTTNMKELISYFKARTLDIAQDEHTYLVSLIWKELNDKSPEFASILKDMGVSI